MFTDLVCATHSNAEETRRGRIEQCHGAVIVMIIFHVNVTYSYLERSLTGFPENLRLCENVISRVKRIPNEEIL